MAFSDYLGELAAIFGAICFGVGNVIIKSQGGKIKPFAINALRLTLTAIIYIILVASLGVLNETFTLEWKAALFFTGGTVIGVVIGDMIFYFSQQLIGLSRAYPIAASYPLLTYIVGLIFKYEYFEFLRMLGVLFVIIGVYLVTISTANNRKSKSEERVDNLEIENTTENNSQDKMEENQITNSSILSEELHDENNNIEKIQTNELHIITTDLELTKKNLVLGISGAFGTAVCWTIGTTMMDQAFNFYDSPLPGAFASVPANAFRMVCVAPIALLIFVPSNRGKYKSKFSWKGVLLILLAGIIGNTAGSLLYVLALQFSTASTTAAITAAAPLIATPLSVIFLKEKITWKLIIGTVLTVTGIWLIIIF
ncbi:MAG TPA: DMT family transporter [candidate division Zixibacteria bacterium]|nr:DMT family transporter [candidate division Zixibacteria bacterium]